MELSNKLRTAAKRTQPEKPDTSIIEVAWLHYYNDVLFKKGVLSKAEWLEMKRMIDRGEV